MLPVPSQGPYQVKTLVYLNRHELNFMPFSTYLRIHTGTLHVEHLCVLRRCLRGDFCILLNSAQILGAIFIIKTKTKHTKTFRNLCLQTYNFRIWQRWLSSCPATRELHLDCFLPLHMWILLSSYRHSH